MGIQKCYKRLKIVLSDGLIRIRARPNAETYWGWSFNVEQTSILIPRMVADVVVCSVCMEKKRAVLLHHSQKARASEIRAQPKNDGIIIMVMQRLEEDVVQSFVRGNVEESRVPRRSVLGDEAGDEVRVLCQSLI